MVWQFCKNEQSERKKRRKNDDRWSILEHVICVRMLKIHCKELLRLTSIRCNRCFNLLICNIGLFFLALTYTNNFFLSLVHILKLSPFKRFYSFTLDFFIIIWKLKGFLPSNITFHMYTAHKKLLTYTVCTLCTSKCKLILKHFQINTSNCNEIMYDNDYLIILKCVNLTVVHCRDLAGEWMNE